MFFIKHTLSGDIYLRNDIRNAKLGISVLKSSAADLKIDRSFCLIDSLQKALCKYENLIVVSDFNIDIKRSNSDKDKLENFSDLLNLTNLVLSETCFMKNIKCIIDLTLTNKPLHIQKTHVVEKVLSDHHKLISTFFNKHGPLKNKFVRGNNAPFMRRESQKKIHVRTTLKAHFQV